MKKRPSVSESSARRTADSNLIDTNRKAQCRRIAAYLQRHGAGTTLELRAACNSLYPPARIRELRELGWIIRTAWVWASDEKGRPHRVGRYVLIHAGGAA